MTTITRERIELFIKAPLENGLTRSEQMELARIALASLEAEPIAWECGENIILFNPDTVEAYAKRADISPKPLFTAPPALPDRPVVSLETEPVAVNDDMAYAFHHALSDSSLGSDEIEEIKTGLRAAFANVTAPPAPIVPAEIHNKLKAEGLAELLKDVRDYAPLTAAQWEVLANNWYQMFVGLAGDEACRAAMLQGAEPVSQTYNLPELIEGMEVSIDVSTCDADAGNRYFGTVTEV